MLASSLNNAASWIVGAGGIALGGGLYKLGITLGGVTTMLKDHDRRISELESQPGPTTPFRHFRQFPEAS